MTDYLDKFTALLVQLQADERDEVIEFYREYLLDADIQTYADCVAELGAPKQLARKVLADYSIRFNENLNANTSKHQKSKAGMRAIWWVILALLSTPITIPALLVIMGVLLTLAIMIFAMAVVIVVGFVTVTILALTMITAGIGIFMQSLATALFYLGVGLALLGIELLILPLVLWFIGLIIQGVSTIIQRLYQRFVTRNRAERGQRHEKNH